MVSRSGNNHLYGLNPAFEVLRARRREVRIAYLNASSRKTPRVGKLVGIIEKAGIPLEWVERGKLDQLANTREHQGVVLEAAPFEYASMEDLLTFPRLILTDNVEDPHNLGAILRSAEVFGFSGVMLPRRGVPGILPSVVKASAGACEYLAVAQDHSANQYARAALDSGYTVVALDAAGTAELDLVASGMAEKLLLVVGGEGRGVGQFILNEATHTVSIPQQGRVNSLNASVAASIAMFALRGESSAS